MDKNKNIQLLEQFFNGTITRQEVKQLLEELKMMNSKRNG